MAPSVLSAVLYGLLIVGSNAQVPSIESATNGDLTLTASAGDIKVVTSGSTCTTAAPCGLGAMASMMTQMSGVISNLQSSATVTNGWIANLNSSVNLLPTSTDLAAVYLTQQMATQTYAPNASLANYATVTESTDRDDATRIFATNLVNALANLTLNQTEYHVLTSHEDLGILDNNGTLSASINVNGAASLATLVPLLNHVVMVTGDVVITNIPLASISTLTGLFGNLVTVGGNVVITDSHGLTSLGVAFPSLTSIGGMVQVTGCDSLTNMDGAFPRLQSIGTFMKLYSNDLYVSNRTGTAFAMLNSIGGQSLTLGGIPFVAATMIHYGDIVSYPGSTSTQGDFATAVRNSAGIRIITGKLEVRQDTTLTSFNPLGGDLVSVGGQLVLYNCDAVTSMNGLMPNLRVTGGQLYLHSLSGVTTFGTAFANLQMIGGNLYFRYSSRGLVSLRNAFPQLRNITGALQLYNLEYVTDMSGSFPELRWVNSLLNMYYLRRVSVGTLFPKVEYAGGIRIQKTFYYSSTSSTMNLDGIFPMLLRVGSANFLIRDCEYATSMNNAFPLLVRNDRALDIYSNQRMQTITGSFPLLAYNGYTFRFQYNAAMTTMDGAFPALQSVGNWMYLRNFNALLSMDGAFTSLRIVPQQLYIIDNNRLASMNNSFTSLTTIGSNFYLYRSYSLTSLGNSFENIQSIENLKFYGLGSSSSQSSNQDAFCASARAVLCPVSTRITSVSWRASSSGCCNPYCATTPSPC